MMIPWRGGSEWPSESAPDEDGAEAPPQGSSLLSDPPVTPGWVGGVGHLGRLRETGETGAYVDSIGYRVMDSEGREIDLRDYEVLSVKVKGRTGYALARIGWWLRCRWAVLRYYARGGSP